MSFLLDDKVGFSLEHLLFVIWLTHCYFSDKGNNWNLVVEKKYHGLSADMFYFCVLLCEKKMVMI